ncbi:MAG TPA: AsmA family protein, partial [Thermoanaerobaculia bacterium]
MTPEQSPPARRRPGRLRRWLLRPFVWGLVLLLAAAFGLYELAQSRFARERALALAVARVSDFLHRPVTIGSAEYSLIPWADVVLRDVRIPGPHPGDPPLATAEMVHVVLPWADLRRRIVRLEQIEAVRPRVHLIFNPDGTSNLPQFGTPGGGPRRFEVRIGHVVVQDGEFELNQRRVQFSLDARAIWGRMTGSGRRLDAMVTAQEVETDLPGARPYRATVSGKGSLLLDGGRFEIAAARVAGPDLSARASGTISWRGGARVDLRFDADGAAAIANRLGYLAEPIGGGFRVADGRVLVDPHSWSYAGTVTSPRVDFREWTVTGLEARLDGHPTGLTIGVARASYGGGSIAGKVSVDTASNSPRGKPVALDLAFREVAVESVLETEKAPLHGLSGAASGRLVYRCNASAALAGSGRAEVKVAARSATLGLPVDGQGTLAIAAGVITSRDIRLTAPQQSATGELAVDLKRRSGR